MWTTPLITHNEGFGGVPCAPLILLHLNGSNEHVSVLTGRVLGKNLRQQIINLVRDLVYANRRIAVRKLAEEVNISVGLCHSIMTKKYLYRVCSLKNRK